MWELYELIKTQRRDNGALDYNVAIALIDSAGAKKHLWVLLELLKVIEIEGAKKESDGA